MSDLDFDAFDNIDFDSVEESVAKKQAIKDKKEQEEVEALREGANDCLSGSCSKYNPRVMG